MREIKFRFFDGEKMCPVGELTFFEGGGYNINEEFPSTGKDPYPLMQYTGLHDKNGKEIYEGDIIEDTFKGRWSIVWNNHYVAFRGQNGNKQRLMGDEVVIGNIYSNPELLTQQKEV